MLRNVLEEPTTTFLMSARPGEPCNTSTAARAWQALPDTALHSLQHLHCIVLQAAAVNPTVQILTVTTIWNRDGIQFFFKSLFILNGSNVYSLHPVSSFL